MNIDSKVMRKIIGNMRKALNDYDMIREGDTVAVGLSGGKDSLALVTALAMYRRYSPVTFELCAIRIDMGLRDTDSREEEALNAYMSELGVTYKVVRTDMAQIIFDIRQESNPCSLCSKMRRGALISECKESGVTKLALGHNADDLTETFLLSLIYEGRLSVFSPVTELTGSGITVIRPFIYCPEGDIRGAVKRLGLPVLNNPCPMNHHSRREYMKELCKNICKDIPFAKERMHSAITHPERYNLFPPKKD